MSNRDGSCTMIVSDTSGDMRYRTSILAYYPYALEFLLIYSVNDRSLFDDVKRFINDIKNCNTKRPLIMLAGNKCDLKDQREVSYEGAKNVANEFDIFYIEVSAKTGFNTECIFLLLCQAILKDLNSRVK
ncbi:unnamed protein product [Blepharisma stoltei]|uniref:Uncharacterized protein n=1 Tax=Blepharisma stoltei TaxID=1481888 RepID=A0AAU9JE65_9CILI|nr:unnamed protein product [Blepharisma stoltei]